MANCSICDGPLDVKRHPETGEVYWDKGENAEPVNEGRCCLKCNSDVVIPKRLELMRKARGPLDGNFRRRAH